MHYLDPLRPKGLNSLPFFISQGGAPCGPLPSLSLQLDLDDPRFFWVNIWANYEPNRAREYNVRLLPEEIPELLARWLLDPEKVMGEEFKWEWQGTGRIVRPNGRAPSLEELGLL